MGSSICVEEGLAVFYRALFPVVGEKNSSFGSAVSVCFDC